MHAPQSPPRELHVVLGTRRIAQGSLFVDCPPVLSVHVGCDQEWSIAAAKPPQHNGIRYAALIDTGAEATVISEETAVAIGAVKAASAIVHGFGGTKTVEAADIQVFIPSQNIVFASRAAISGSIADGHTFSVALGRSFLEHCRLEVDGPSGTYRLWWVA